LKHFAQCAYERRIQMFLAQAIETRITLHAFACIYRGPLDDGIDGNRAHGAHVGAIAAGHAFVRIDLHAIFLLASIFKNRTAASTHRSDVIRNGTFQPNFAAVVVTT